jgi:hypothetical protein
MSKEHVTLEIKAGKLVIRRRYSSRSVELNDPDGSESIKVVADGDECPIVNDIEYGWSEWEACTYVRKSVP